MLLQYYLLVDKILSLFFIWVIQSLGILSSAISGYVSTFTSSFWHINNLNIKVCFSIFSFSIRSLYSLNMIQDISSIKVICCCCSQSFGPKMNVIFDNSYFLTSLSVWCRFCLVNHIVNSIAYCFHYLIMESTYIF